MWCADNLRPAWRGSFFFYPGAMSAACLWLSIFFLCSLAGCDQMESSRRSQLMRDAEAKSAQGDFARAIHLYEAALDDSESSRTAEVHYKLALLYDDKLKDPVSALHHFKRYLALSPNGPHANDAKNSIKRDQITALTELSGDSVITRSEAARLRNENLDLRKELEARRGSLRAGPEKLQPDGTTSKKALPVKRKRTYIVQSGDTLFSISRKFYKSSRRWKEILAANRKNIRDPKELTVGQTLVIP
jgi:tetratricopeptide (TPR) repeat protein